MPVPKKKKKAAPRKKKVPSVSAAVTSVENTSTEDIGIKFRISTDSITRLEVGAYCADAMIAFEELERLNGTVLAAQQDGDLALGEMLMPQLVGLRDKISTESDRCTRVADQFRGVGDGAAFDHANRYARIAFDRDGRAHGIVDRIQRTIQEGTARIVDFSSS